jgi:hypothetical protein
LPPEHNIKASQLQKVTALQWSLLYLSLALAGGSFFITSYDGLVLLAVLLTADSSLIAVLLIKETIQTRLPGKFLLGASTLFFFWVEALNLAFQDQPFTATGLPVPFSQFSQGLIKQSYLYVAIFQLMLFIGYSIRPRLRGLYNWIGSRVKSKSFRGSAMPYVLAACALFPLLLSLNFNLTATLEVLTAARSGAEIEAEDVGLLHFLSFFGMYGAAILLAEAVLFRSTRRVWSLVLGVLAALPFIMGGARHLWLFVALPACILISLSEQKLSALRVFRWAALSMVMVVILQLQFLVRQEGWNQVGSVESNKLFDADVAGQFSAMLYAEYLVPERHDYFLEIPEKYFVIHWIPRQFWPDKPVMQSWEFYNGEYTQGQAFNVTPSIIGQYHMSFGFVGVIFIGSWLGFLTRLADRALLVIELERQLAMAIAIGMFYAFIISSFRFYSPIYFAYFLFAMIGMMLLTSRRRSHAARPGEVNAYRSLPYPRVS